MKFDKKGSSILLSGMKSEELFAFLKFQIPAKLVFLDSEENINQEISLFSRDYFTEKVIEIEIEGQSDIINYKELLEKISEFMFDGSVGCTMIDVAIFKQKEPLIHLMQTINQGFITNCVSIDYFDNIFEIVNVPFPNNDPDKLYYFELNDTILGFSKDGPILITDNTSITSIQDIVQNY